MKKFISLTNETGQTVAVLTESIFLIEDISASKGTKIIFKNEYGTDPVLVRETVKEILEIIPD